MVKYKRSNKVLHKREESHMFNGIKYFEENCIPEFDKATLFIYVILFAKIYALWYGRDDKAS